MSKSALATMIALAANGMCVDGSPYYGRQQPIIGGSKKRKANPVKKASRKRSKRARRRNR